MLNIWGKKEEYYKVSPKTILKVLEEREKFKKDLFSKQLEVFECEEPMIAIKTSRRSGKTYFLLSMALDQATRTPYTMFPYIALTKGSARDIVWPVLQALDRKHKLNINFNNHTLTATLPNQSQICLFGGDRADAQTKLLGGGSNIGSVFVDEAAAFTSDLESFINDVIVPILLDRGGKLYLAGAPTAEGYGGYFWKITRNEIDKRLPGWEVFEWGTPDNPYVENQYKKQLNRFQTIFGDKYLDFPWFQRQWLGLWATDSEDNVYFGYDPIRNSANSKPRRPYDRFVLGMDTGYADGMAFVIGSYNTLESNKLWIHESLWKTKMMTNEIAQQIRRYQEKYPGLVIVGDTNNAQLLEELRVRYQIPVFPADKTDKNAWIRFINNDFMLSDIMLCDPDGVNFPLNIELLKLKRKYTNHEKWEEDVKSLWIEDKTSSTNHCTDAMLYLYRHCFQYTHKKNDTISLTASERENRMLDKFWKDKLNPKSLKSDNKPPPIRM